MQPTTWELIGRVALAALLTAIIGIERELDRHPAGIRTHAIVGMGSALFTVVGTYGFGPNHDSARVAAQVVTGIGFLGAGAILRQRDKVKGLTTAAALWLAAGIGVTAGAGLIGLTLAAFAMTLVVLLADHVTGPFVQRFTERRELAARARDHSDRDLD